METRSFTDTPARPSLFDGLPAIEPSAATGFAGGGLDRRAEMRGPDATAEALADPSARVYVFAADKPLTNGNEPRFGIDSAIAAGARREDMLLLGWKDGAPRLACRLPGNAEPATEPADLRSLAVAGEIDGGILGELALARSLTGWHARHGFCANCGAKTRSAAGGFRRDCDACNTSHFPRTDPVVIMLAIDGDRALLGRSARFAPGMYSCLAGFMEPGETIEEAVRRETLEESGIRLGRVRYHASQPWPFVSSLMIGCLGEAITTEIVPDDNELEDCRWFDRDEVKTMIARTHPDGLGVPVKMAIAYHLITAWIDATA